jgi:hypothetical protein
MTSDVLKLLSEIDDEANIFLSDLSVLEKKMFDKILILIKDLETDKRTGKIKNNLKNIKLIGQLKKEIRSVVLSKPYLKSVTKYTRLFDKVDKVNDRYLADLFNEEGKAKVLEEVKKANIDATIQQLTENGIAGGLEIELNKILRTNITSGGSYSDLADKLRRMVVGDDESESYMQKNANRIVKDAVHQYNRGYMKTVSDDLGFEWFEYVGSLKENSRDFCRHMVEKRYFHKSEIPDLLEGNIDGTQVDIYDKTGLPEGMIDGTNEDNFQILAGGYGCNHGIYAVPEVNVPEEIRESIIQ